MSWTIITHDMDALHEIPDMMEQSGQTILTRAVNPLLSQAIATMPVITVLGARQTGKTTLVKSHPELQSHVYLTMDDLNVRDQARSNMIDFVHRHPQIIIDEVQREPDLLLAVKRVVDEDPMPGRFVLTGSANLLLMQHVSETLAGRGIYITLWPMTRRERIGKGDTGPWSLLYQHDFGGWYDLFGQVKSDTDDWQKVALTGGFPVPALRLNDSSQRDLWFQGYIQTYLERDLQDLSSVDQLMDVRRVARAAASRLGGILNETELSRDVGIPRTTVHRYLNLLETSYLLLRLESYSVNRTRRLIKAPKLYWTDTGLALHLSGEDPDGRHFENFILQDLLVWSSSRSDRPNVMYWRTASGQEVDFVLEIGNNLIGIEVKASSAIRSADLKNLKAFQDEYGERVRGNLLIYCGDELFRAAEGILAVPWWYLI